MQLATSQRAHPPPVPPRPSRQVVAEALKRTARPPCPTRQAPPPPNTRPWRFEDDERGAAARLGRTVVYDSGRDEQQRTNGEQVPTNRSQLQRAFASPRCNDESLVGHASHDSDSTVALAEKTEERVSGSTRAASERNPTGNQRERLRQQLPLRRRSNGNERCDRENSNARTNAGDSQTPLGAYRRSVSDENVLAYRETEDCDVRTSFIAGLVAAGPRDDVYEGRKKKLLEKLSSNDDEASKVSEQEDRRTLDRNANEGFAGLTEVGGRYDDVDVFRRRSSSLAKNAESTSATVSSTTPTTIDQKSNDNHDAGKVVGAWGIDDEPRARKTAEDNAAVATGSATTISSDDCATVVVVDEPQERKIAFNDDNDNIQHQDWLEAGIRYSSTKITLPGDDPVDRSDECPALEADRDNERESDDELRSYDKFDHSSICKRIAMSSLQGLPPLPRSLSGFNLSEGRREAADPPPPPARSSSKTQKNVKSTQPSSSRPSPPGRQLTTLDTQLAILRKEMFGLRQLDLSLLSQLWSLNESIQEFRQLLQEQEDRAPSPSPSSEEGDDNSYGSHPPPPPRRPAPLLHHHRPPRPPRPLRPPASDESPSSEEYGAV